jgi:hypothetical protein
MLMTLAAPAGPASATDSEGILKKTNTYGAIAYSPYSRSIGSVTAKSKEDAERLPCKIARIGPIRQTASLLCRGRMPMGRLLSPQSRMARGAGRLGPPTRSLAIGRSPTASGSAAVTTAGNFELKMLCHPS